jgi:hypothetical protein
MRKIKQIYHRYEKWEDYKNGMYSLVSVGEVELLVGNAYSLLANPFILKSAMRRVVNEWIISSELNMTNLESNRRAWLGAAACSLIQDVPEYLTRVAWNTLTSHQQTRANDVANQIIDEWEIDHLNSLNNTQQIELFKVA